MLREILESQKAEIICDYSNDEYIMTKGFYQIEKSFSITLGATSYNFRKGSLLRIRPYYATSKGKTVSNVYIYDTKTDEMVLKIPNLKDMLPKSICDVLEKIKSNSKFIDGKLTAKVKKIMSDLQEADKNAFTNKEDAIDFINSLKRFKKIKITVE